MPKATAGEVIAKPSRPLLIYRWIVFLLAGFYSVYQITTSDYFAPGGPFRFLTIWALLCSFFAASRLIALAEGRSTRRWDGFISMTAVLNAMVVFLYWRLYFDDPTSVTRNGQLQVWWLEYYLHLVGPLLQWIDALFFHRAFRAPKRATLWLLGLISAYLIWAELFVQRFNSRPLGSVTNGLPYPFLNNMTIDDRLMFYMVQAASALMLLAAFSILAWGINRLSRPSRAPAAPSDNPDKAA